MRICLFNGGLGNQVFQYIFSRWMELATGEPCYLDDSAFWLDNVAHNGYEIPKVFPNSKPRLLSDFFEPDVWEYMVEQYKAGVPVYQQIKNLGEDIVVVTDNDSCRFDGHVVNAPENTYLPMLADYKGGNVYFYGYWINREWLKGDFYNILREELRFVPITEEHNLSYASMITTSLSISMHIRRGDFVELNRARTPQTYRVLVECTEQAIDDAHYFIFSDDLEWCKANKKELGLELGEGRVTFVEGNSGAISFRDMQLMSMCKGNILVGGSSFSYLAALLNIHEAPITINSTERQV